MVLDCFLLQFFLCVFCVLELSPSYTRDSIGDSAISGDLRWAGSYGVNVDFVARSHCAVEIILLEDMQASAKKTRAPD